MGYPVDLLLTPHVDEVYKCYICKEVLESPTTIISCRHTFCKHCIYQFKECPFDQNPIFTPDDGFKLEPATGVFLEGLNALKIKCVFAGAGCSHYGSVGNIHEHHDSCDYNPVVKVPCPKNCGARIRVDEVHDCVKYLKQLLTEKNEQIEHGRMNVRVMTKIIQAYANENDKGGTSSVEVVSAKIRWRVQKISQLKESRESHFVIVGGLPWRLKIFRFAATAYLASSLAFFVKCDGTPNSIDWTQSVSATMKILPCRPGGTALTRSISHNFTPDLEDWGYSKFVDWDELMNTANGYIADDAVTFEVHIKVHGADDPAPPPIVPAEEILIELI